MRGETDDGQRATEPSLLAKLREPLPPSAVALILANLAPLAGIIALGWDVGDLMVLFWLENVIIGVFNILKMLANRAGGPQSWIAKTFLIPFFTVHYGGFTFVHGVFVLALFGSMQSGDGLFSLAAISTWITVQQLWIGVAALVASHGFSFYWNYIRGGENKELDLGQLMTRPYTRVVILHITIIFGAVPTMLLGSPIAALLLLLGLKVAVDITAHLKEHRGERVGDR